MSFKKVIAVFASVFAFSAFALAQDSTTTTQNDSTKQEQKHERRGGFKRGGMDGERRGGHRGGFGMRGLEKLNLTDAQKEQIHQVMESNKTAFGGNRDEMRQLHEAKKNGTLTADQQIRFDALRTQMRENMRQTHEKIMAILTTEQKAQLEQMKQEHEKRREEFRKNRVQNQTTQDKSQDN